MFKPHNLFKSAFLRKDLAYLLQTAFSILAVTILAIISSSKTIAQGNLVINTHRIVFQGQKNTQDFNLTNIGKDTARYVISFIELRMTKDGQFEKLAQPDSGQHFASSHLRFYPQSATLAPNESQSVNVQIYKPELLLPGEYRSHMYIRGEPKEDKPGQAEMHKDSSKFSLHITPIFGLTIPVIIDKGESTTKVLISNISVEIIKDSITELHMTFNRSGNMSVYGNLIVNYVSTKGIITEVAVIKGIAVYSPTASRQLKMQLAQKPGVDYHNGKLNVVYKMLPENNDLKIAEGNLILH